MAAHPAIWQGERWPRAALSTGLEPVSAVDNRALGTSRDHLPEAASAGGPGLSSARGWNQCPPSTTAPWGQVAPTLLWLLPKVAPGCPPPGVGTSSPRRRPRLGDKARTPFLRLLPEVAPGCPQHGVGTSVRRRQPRLEDK